MNGKLILTDGTTFHGKLLKDVTGLGEVVFNTGMTGYQEVLTDPSYCGQIVTMTYPMIGNYGAAKDFMEARKSFVRGFVVDELSKVASNWQSEESIVDFLLREEIPCLYDVDTRAVTRCIRSGGAMKGLIVREDMAQDDIDRRLAEELSQDVVAEVTTSEIYTLDAKAKGNEHVVVMDFGIKRHILESLREYGFHLTVVPAHTTADEVLALQPDGIFLSNGPGDPKALPGVIEEIKKLIGQKPLFGICLGHQLFSLAMGADTRKMKFGHRGSNQPVKNIAMNRVHITSQNHGYVVDERSLEGLPLEVTHRAVNDDTVEGLRHLKLPAFTVQYHPEASPGLDDNRYLFDAFRALIHA
ncbi:carbamoyl phosphate synthase small subunit [Selenomonas sp. TAMA-11512]|uniref:glutamine-hydrolyzing carbamoyl-phosphate synthase small subunit n=1 Tax=Selenomonas sp. TAMA-11512 TaxID=3095337 RepID=UPI003090EE8D|nr:carbamoyl phosphate synthase small subunit [Selenomonas sp. TAMA-11512]